MAFAPRGDPNSLQLVADGCNIMILAISPGETFAGYRVESLVGRGGMGVVYRAMDLSLQRPVALKLIAPELAEDEHFRARFHREPRLAASLDHPSVVPIYEAGEWEGQLYLAMRYVEGSDLRTVVEREGKLTPEFTVGVLAQVADALDGAHRRGLVHRDVKPANILLDEDGHAYLTDFGITKQLEGDTTDGERLVGTLDYLAPEQIRGEEVDGRADCYALGCVLYECLAGTPPFRRATEAETLWAHMQEEALPLPENTALDEVIHQALAKERENRPGTCTEFVGAAGEALGVGAHPLASRRRSRATLLLLLAGVLLGAAVVLAVARSTGDEVSDPGALLDVATNSVAAVNARTGKLAPPTPLPGRPTDVAAGVGTAWVATVDSTTVTGVSGRRRSTLPRFGRLEAPTRSPWEKARFGWPTAGAVSLPASNQAMSESCSRSAFRAPFSNLSSRCGYGRPARRSRPVPAPFG